MQLKYVSYFNQISAMNISMVPNCVQFIAAWNILVMHNFQKSFFWGGNENRPVKLNALHELVLENKSKYILIVKLKIWYEDI